MNAEDMKLEELVEETKECMYSHTGECPKCGEPLDWVLIYSGRKLASSVSKTHRGDYIKTTTTTTYKDITPLDVGYCPNCHKEIYNEKENQKALKPVPKALMLISLAILLYGLIYLIILIFFGGEHHNVDLGNTALSVIFNLTGVFSLGLGFILFLYNFIKFLINNKKHKKYLNGYREPFVKPEDDKLAVCARRYMAKSGNKSLTYFTPKEVEMMRRNS